MLIYCKGGVRSYLAHPMRPQKPRLAWEFQAVLRGEITRCEPGHADENGSSRLWLSGPRSFHGWSARTHDAAEVAVFHYPTISPLLASRIGDTGHVSVTLDASERSRISFWIERLSETERHSAPLQILLQDAALAELTLLVFERLAPRNTTGADSHWERIEAALKYFEQNLPTNPGLDAVARAGRMSTAHFRRLCHTQLGKSPKAICEEIRIRRILHLLADKAMAIHEIAEQTGYSEPSALSRAFKLRFGLSPRQWRETRSIGVASESA